MAKLFKILGILVIVGILAFIAIGFSLPRQYKVERKTVIKAQPETVYSMLDRTRTWREWTIWNERDPGMTTEYSGPEVGVGSKMSWQSKTEGNGSLTITESNPPTNLVYLFEMPDMGTSSTGRMNLEAVEEGTLIVWSDEGDLGNNPVFRYFGLVIDDLIGQDFDSGLANLKTLAESKQQAQAAETAVPEAVSNAVAELKGALGSALMTQIQQEGATEAVAYCSLEALPLTNQVSTETGVTVSRITDKPRNPNNMADEAGLAVLAEMAADKANGEMKPHYQKDGRFYFPLTIQPMCLTCHGQNVAGDVAEVIAQKYPEDQATGYALDDLRGAIVVQ